MKYTNSFPMMHMWVSSLSQFEQIWTQVRSWSHVIWCFDGLTLWGVGRLVIMCQFLTWEGTVLHDLAIMLPCTKDKIYCTKIGCRGRSLEVSNLYVVDFDFWKLVLTCCINPSTSICICVCVSVFLYLWKLSVWKAFGKPVEW